MSVLCRTAAVPRESAAVGVFSKPLRRISSESPGTIRSAIAWVDSGVLSRGPIPVPPVVKSTSTRLESARRPQHDFVNSVVAFDFSDLRVAALPAGKIQLPLRAVVLHDQTA